MGEGGVGEGGIGAEMDDEVCPYIWVQVQEMGKDLENEMTMETTYLESQIETYQLCITRENDIPLLRIQKRYPLSELHIR